MKSTRVPPEVYADVMALDAYRCAWCWTVDRNGRAVEVEFHHRLPRSRARNLHDRLNGVALCVRHHHEAHATNRWPWLVPGSTLRGAYTGADPIYHSAYSGGPTPTYRDVQDVFPEASRAEVEWAMLRLANFLPVATR